MKLIELRQDWGESTNPEICGDNDPEPSRGVLRGEAYFGRKSSNPAQHTQLAQLEAHNPPFLRPELPTPTYISSYFSLGRGTSRWTPGHSVPGAPAPSAINPIQSTAPNANVCSMGTATAWLEINKRVPRATFAALAEAGMAPPSNHSQITRSHTIAPSIAKWTSV